MTGAGGPQLSLPDLNPVVGAQIRGVVEGQLALLYTARAQHLARNGSRLSAGKHHRRLLERDGARGHGVLGGTGGK